MRKTIEEGDLLGDLVYRRLEWWEISSLEICCRLEVKTHDTDAIAELFDVFSGARYATRIC